MHTRDLLIGAAAGATLMCLFDANAGGRRRALVRDKFVRASRKTRDGADATARDIRNRARGIVAATRGRWRSEHVEDDILVERVRAKLGRACSHPRAIDVDANDGVVTLRGQILADEVSGLLATIAAVRGVGMVNNELDVHESSEGVPSLQGRGQMAGPSVDILQRNWAPATQAAVGAGLVGACVLMAMHARTGRGVEEPYPVM